MNIKANIEIYLTDLNEEAQKRIKSILGDNFNYDICPICVIEIDELNKNEEILHIIYCDNGKTYKVIQDHKDDIYPLAIIDTETGEEVTRVTEEYLEECSPQDPPDPDFPQQPLCIGQTDNGLIYTYILRVDENPPLKS